MDRLPRLLVLLAAAAGAAIAAEPGAIGSAAELAAFLGGGAPDVRAFSVTGRVVVDGTLPSGVTHRVRLLGERREPVVFEFRPGEPAGRPAGDKSTRRDPMTELDSINLYSYCKNESN